MSYDVVALFSGGLDSLLAARILIEQNLRVLCAHFTSPFFGNAQKVPHWRRLHGLDVISLDIGAEFAAMLAAGPDHGLGKNLNPCMDCKIMQFRAAKRLMEEHGAGFIATGEVVGQRPMSQRRDSLGRIQNVAGLRGLVLRPLSALLLEPTLPELQGRVRRQELFGLSGRGRNGQLELAQTFGLAEIPSPAGGCLLTEKENTRRYWPVLQRGRALGQSGPELAREFQFANLGRQFWRQSPAGPLWLAIGRTRADNERLQALAGDDDLILRLADFPGPLGIARAGRSWGADMLKEACALLAAYSPRAMAAGGEAQVLVMAPDNQFRIPVHPSRDQAAWALPAWEEIRLQIEQGRKHAADR